MLEFIVTVIVFSVDVISPVHSTNSHPSDGLAVNRITLPELYSVVVFPDEIISSETVPEPVIETVRGYFLLTKLAVKLMFWLTVIVSGFSVEPLDQFSNIYSEFGEAVMVTELPSL